MQIHIYGPKETIPLNLIEQYRKFDLELFKQENLQIEMDFPGYADKPKKFQMRTAKELEVHRVKQNLTTILITDDTLDQLLGFAELYTNASSLMTTYWCDKVGTAEYCWIDQLFVNPQCRNQGIGSLLLTEAFNYARQHKFTYLLLGVMRRNTAGLNLYMKHHFTVLETVLVRKCVQTYEKILNYDWQKLDSIDSTQQDLLCKQFEKQMQRNVTYFPPLHTRLTTILNTFKTHLLEIGKPKSKYTVFHCYEQQNNFVIAETVDHKVLIHALLTDTKEFSKLTNQKLILYSLQNYLSATEKWIQYVCLDRTYKSCFQQCGYKPISMALIKRL